ncbi:MAG: hypothetical protein BECKG1743F_GA0114225_111251, partial [Candidatus Kentron sp. G]
PADVKCLGFLYLYVGRYPRNNASRNSQFLGNGPRGRHSLIELLVRRVLGENEKYLPNMYALLQAKTVPVLFIELLHLSFVWETLRDAGIEPRF